MRFQTHSRRSAVAAALAMTMLGALGVVTGVGFARTSVGAAQYQYGKKATICHRTKSKKHPFVTITVSQNAVQAHLNHGDKLGPCPTTTSTTTSTPTSTASSTTSSEKGKKGKKAKKKATTQKAEHQRKAKKEKAATQQRGAKAAKAPKQSKAPKSSNGRGRGK